MPKTARKSEKIHKKGAFAYAPFSYVWMVTPTGLEPMLPPWKGGVLTAWPWGHLYKTRFLSADNASIDALVYVTDCSVLSSMVAAMRFELMTYRVWTDRSNQLSYAAIWLRGQDSNLRPSGYEPDELPSCSTPRCQNGLLKRRFKRNEHIQKS